MVTSADTNIQEIQEITTTAFRGQTLGGSFTLTFDDTATGGSVQTTGPIMWDAEAMTKGTPDKTSVEEIIEALQNVDDVSVFRTEETDDGASRRSRRPDHRLPAAP